MDAGTPIGSPPPAWPLELWEVLTTLPPRERPGAEGELIFGERSSGQAHIPRLTVVEAVPPRLFSFRWTHPQDEDAREGNSLLVTFELTTSAGGTLLRMTESGFREMGWEVAVLEQQYQEHVEGWDHFLPRLVGYSASVARAS